MNTKTTWKGGLAFESTYKNSSIHIDSNNGFSPKALLLTGLAGCTGVDVVSILEKMRVPFADLKIEVQTEQTESDPKVFKDLHIVFRLKTGEENREKVKKAIDLSLEKYCGVAAMLRKNSSISYILELEPEF
ncbi:OsmC family protein [Chitinophagaceae bacterium LB-8]|uniref:OsmC family protein n=1 Tax=Paraflavisolibacter caeni TaxID=2982496 RepID=A0A9X2XS59_9BACT|nr:OsmC family protein [Paraflavisolibacter caeni]MCU7547841.1 OsmC family protein [Paraflavisolibacter caeni]